MTDIRERYSDREEEARIWLDSLQARMWTALPGIIQGVTLDNGAPYASVALAAKGTAVADDGSISSHDLPGLPHCPLYFPRGGGFSLTFPVKQGDECLVIFASRSIDDWWQSGKGQTPYDLRQHDLSDGIAFVGLTSSARPLADISEQGAQLRSDDGGAVIDLQNDAITMTVGSCVMRLTSSGLTVSGGTVSSDSDVLAKGISLSGHVHPGVQSGSATTQKPE